MTRARKYKNVKISKSIKIAVLNTSINHITPVTSHHLQPVDLEIWWVRNQFFLSVATSATVHIFEN